MVRISNKDLNEAGQILKADYNNKDAFNKIASWRRLHTHVINRFKVSLNRCIKENKGINQDYIVTQRLKRMPTILNKISSVRYQGKLSDMQDIGGLRIIVKNVEEVRYLVSIFANKKTKQILKRQLDYITKPKDTGYRGIHLVYKTQYPSPLYDGLQIEIQFRTELQHIWATAVETVDTILNKSLKFDNKDPEWLDFFALVSSAFALQEKQPVLEAHKNLLEAEIRGLIIKKEKELKVKEKIAFVSELGKTIKENKLKKLKFVLLIIDIANNQTRYILIEKEDDANTAYEMHEQGILNGVQNDIVLIKIDDIKKLRKAYPNYFLDTTDFVKQLNKILTH